MENVFDSLALIVTSPENRPAFLEEEGIELMIRMLKERRLSRVGALKVLDHTLATRAGECRDALSKVGASVYGRVLLSDVLGVSTGAEACEVFVKQGGLKVSFFFCVCVCVDLNLSSLCLCSPTLCVHHGTVHLPGIYEDAGPKSAQRAHFRSRI